MADFFINERTQRDLGWPQILAALAARTQTPRGHERALAWAFLPDTAAVQQSLARVEEARGLLQARERIPLAGSEDVRAALHRAAKQAVLNPVEILACGRLLNCALQVRRYLTNRREILPLLSRIAQGLPEHRALAEDIEAAIEPSGTIKDTASPALAELRQRALQLHRQIKERIETLLQAPEYEGLLQDSYFSVRGDRYVVPVVSSFRSKLPGIVHNASQSGQTVFVEPQEIVPLGNELTIAQSLAQEEEQRILAVFSAELGEQKDNLLGAIELLAELDLASAGAALAQDLEASTPILEESGGTLMLRGLRHPLLVLQGKQVVANDVRLDDGQGALVISGPNAGGKTATLTATGLCLLLIRAGLPIPVRPNSSVPVCRGVHCAIGDAQDLGRGLSTFSAHLEQLRDIVQAARRGFVVMIDEIAADTDPQEGAALARGTLEELVQHGARVLVTTHLEEIKALGVVDARFVNARVGCDPGTLRPTYRLETGAAGVSNALAVAQQVGLSEAVLQRARQHLQGAGLLSRALARLNELQDVAAAHVQTLEKDRAALAVQQAELVAQQAAAAEARRNARVTALQDVAQELEAQRQELGQMVAQLQAAPSIRKAQQAQEKAAAQLSHVQQRIVVTQLPVPEMPAGRQVPIKPGMWVHVTSLNQEGEVLQIDATSAQVAMGTLRSRFKLDTLVPIERRKQKGKARAFPGERKKPSEVAAGAVSSGATRCDVRGMRADDALRALERYLDDAFSTGGSALVVVHGHGTGALKDAVRDELRRSPYVSSHRPGDRHEGGDGVTVVMLNQ